MSFEFGRLLVDDGAVTRLLPLPSFDLPLSTAVLDNALRVFEGAGESVSFRRRMSASISSIVRVSRLSLLSWTSVEGLNPALSRSRADPVAGNAGGGRCLLDLSRADEAFLVALDNGAFDDAAPFVLLDVEAVELLVSGRAPARIRAKAMPPVDSPSSRKSAFLCLAAFSSRVWAADFSSFSVDEEGLFASFALALLVAWAKSLWSEYLLEAGRSTIVSPLSSANGRLCHLDPDRVSVVPA